MWSLISLIASTLLSAILAPNNKQESPAAKTLEDVQITTARENVPIPVVFGGVRVTGNVVWYGELREEKIKKKGGKK